MTPPTVSDFKTFFDRDFPFGSTADTVKDSDVTRALAEADAMLNEGLFTSQSVFTMAYQYLAAHNLVMNLRASSQGVAGSFSWLESSKSVGSVSQGFQFPQEILDHPVLAIISKTNYGAKYLQIILPLLVGQCFSVCGATNA